MLQCKADGVPYVDEEAVAAAAAAAAAAPVPKKKKAQQKPVEIDLTGDDDEEPGKWAAGDGGPVAKKIKPEGA